ncbi:MAG: hypothetical protein IPM24_24825 [Bryobacterales bacterium]|nr:hypothetical protein [Bryobacterales bacterium]
MNLALSDPRVSALPAFPIAGRVSTGWVDRTVEGRLVLLRQTVIREAARVTEELVYPDAMETLALPAPLGAWTIDRRVTARGVVGLTGKGEVILWQDGPAEVFGTAEGDWTGGAMSCLLDGETVLFVERRTARLHRVDLRTRSIETRDVGAQEVVERLNRCAQRAAAAKRPSLRPIVAIGLSCRQGQILLSLGNYRFSDGALVLHLNGSGEVIESLRCRLPQAPDYRVSPDNPDGYAQPALLASSGSQLFLLARRGMVLAYRLHP